MMVPTDEQIEAVLRLPVADGEDVAFYLLHGCEGVNSKVETIMVREVARTILAAAIPVNEGKAGDEGGKGGS